MYDETTPNPEPLPIESPEQRAEPQEVGSSREPTQSRSAITSAGLIWVFLMLFSVFIAPNVASRIQYAMTEAKERARLEVARANLEDFKLDQLSTAFRLVAQSVEPSVVNISAGHGQAEGSGVIVDEAGYIVTNHHVVANQPTVQIQLSDGRRGPASVVGTDAVSDVAVLKTELDKLIAAPWGNSDDLSVGEMVWAVGSPFSLQKSITFGILSAKGRRGLTQSLYQEFLQTDAAVNPGNSGGPLVNIDGEIVGINTAIVGPAYRGISFSIPSVLAREIYEQLRKDGWVERGYLGVRPELVTDRLADKLEIDRGQGVLVTHVQGNSPAADAGLQRGDVVITWNEQEFSDPTLLSRTIAATKIGSKVPVEIIRATPVGVIEKTLTVRVGAKPRADSL